MYLCKEINDDDCIKYVYIGTIYFDTTLRRASICYIFLHSNSLRPTPCSTISVLVLSFFLSLSVFTNQSCSNGLLVHTRFLRTSNVLCSPVWISQSMARLRSSTTKRTWRQTTRRREPRRRRSKLFGSFVFASG